MWNDCRLKCTAENPGKAIQTKFKHSLPGPVNQVFIVGIRPCPPLVGRYHALTCQVQCVGHQILPEAMYFDGMSSKSIHVTSSLCVISYVV